MKQRKLLLLPLLALVLAGCTPKPSESEAPSSEAPVSTQSETPSASEAPVSEVPVSEDPVSEVPVSEVPSIDDSEDLPSIPVSEAPVIEELTIAQIRAITQDGKSATAEEKVPEYKTSGIVTAKFRGANISNVGPAWNIAIQDGEHALLLYAITEEDYAANFAAVPIGSELTITGHVAAYNGLRELDRVKYVSHTEGVGIVPENLASIKQADLAGKDSKLVKIEGLKIHSKPTLVAEMSGDRSNITINVDLRKDGEAIGTYMHYNIPMEDAEAAVAKLETATSNSTLTWTGILGMNNGTFQLTNVGADEWDIDLGEPVELTGLAFKKASLTMVLGEKVTPELNVEPWDGKLDGVSWLTDDGAVATVDHTGEITALGVGETVITVMKGAIEATIAVKVIDPAAQTEFVDSFSVKGWSANTSYDTGANVKDYDGLAPTSGATLALRVINGTSGAIRGNKAGDENFSMRNKTEYPGFIRKVSITVSGGTLTPEAGRNVMLLGDVHLDETVFSTVVENDVKAVVMPTEAAAGQATLTWEVPEGVDHKFFRIHSLKTSGTALADAADAIKIEYETAPAGPVEAPKAKVALVNLLTGKAVDDNIDLQEAYVIWALSASQTMVLGTQDGTILVNYFSITGDDRLALASLKKGDYVNMTLKAAENGTGGDFARALIGVPQKINDAHFVVVDEPTWTYDGMAETNTIELSDGFAWLATFTAADLGSYYSVKGTVKSVNGDQIYLEFDSRVDGKSAIGDGNNYIRLSAYKAGLLGFELEIGSTYVVAGIIGGVNQNLPLSGTNNPIFRLYAQSVELVE